jgi:hypothetical protein
MTCSKITAHVFIMIVFALMPFTDSLDQTKPKQSKEGILEWLCQKIEENYSDEIYTTGDEIKYDASTRTISDFGLQNNFIKANVICNRFYDDSRNWRKERTELYQTNWNSWKAGELYKIPQIISYSVFWNRSVSIPIDQLKNVKIYKPKEPHRSHQYYLEFQTKSNAILIYNDASHLFLKHGTDEWDDSIIRNNFSTPSDEKVNSYRII